MLERFNTVLLFSLLVAIDGTGRAVADESKSSAMNADSVLLMSGTFQAEKYSSDDNSHEHALWTIQRHGAADPRFDVFFLPVQGQYEGRPVACTDARPESDDGSVACRRATGDPDVPYEKFQVASLASKFCDSEREKPGGSDAIMAPKECTDEEPTNCFCYSVRHCATAEPEDPCDLEAPKPSADQEISLRIPPGGGGGSGGRWP